MPKRMSDLDAFLALEDIEDEEIKMPLKEGKGFNVRDEKDMDKAEEFVNQDNKKEVSLEVIDVDADSLEHLKNNEEYVGQMILQCNSCKANRFINAEDLVQSEGDEDVYNIEDECPHCHGVGNGFHLIGQVGKIADEDETDATFDNDSLTDEPKFDNEGEEQPAEEQPAEEESSEEEQPEESEESGEEDFEEDDTADMESTLGNEFDSDDVEYDDTEEKPEEPKESKEDSLTDDKDEDNEFTPIELPKEDEKDKKKEESLEEDLGNWFVKTPEDLFDFIIDPENIENVLVFDLDADDAEEEIFKGPYEELPYDLKEDELVGFDVAQGRLTLNIDSEEEIFESTATVRDALRLFTDDFNENISVWDQALGEEVFEGTKQSVLEEFGHNAFLSYEAPERLQLKLRTVELQEGLKTPYKEELDFANPTDKLISNIIKENKLREYNVNKFGSEEYWIAESIKEREDLKHIFENYVVNKSNNLVLEFKDVTGYKDNLDVLYEETLNESSEDNEEETANKAKEKFNNPEVTAVIYGYESRGKFHTLQNGELYEITNDRELQMATELVRAKYHPTGSVKVLYKDGALEESDFRNRKDLTEAILDCESKGIEYKIKRSVKEGYRYTLVKESIKQASLTKLNEDNFYDILLRKSKKYHGVEPTNIEDTNEELTEDNQLGFFEEEDPRDNELADKIFGIVHNIAEAIREVYPEAQVNESALLVDFMSDLHLQSSNPDFFDLANEPLELVQENIKNEFQGFHKALENNEGFSEGEAEQVKQAIADLDSAEFSPEALKEKAQSEEFLNSIEDGEIIGVVLHPSEDEEDSASEDDDEDFEDFDDIDLDDVPADDTEDDDYDNEIVTTKEIECAGGLDNEDELEEAGIEIVSRRNDGNFEYVVLKGPKESIRYFFSEDNGYTDDDLFNSLDESVDIHIEGNDVTIKDDSGEDVAIIPVEPEGEEAPEEVEEEQPEENDEDKVELELDEPVGEELNEGLIYISPDTSSLTDDQINKGLDLIDAGQLIERKPVALENEEDLFLVANKGKNYLGHRKDIDNYLNNFRNEPVTEAKKDEELPADPDVVKTNVHATLNNLVTDEIEAINGYEEAKAEIADTHIEHKDDIIDTIDHIEDEEEEHIDELIDAASDIPFDKEESFDEKKEETNPSDIIPEEEQIALENGEVIYDEEGNVEETLKEEKAKTIKASKIEPNMIVSFGKHWPDVFGQVKSVETQDGKVHITFVDERGVSYDENEEVLIKEAFDEVEFENFINEWFNKNVEETQLFEATNGTIDDNGTIILEGKLLKENDVEQGVSFTLTPNKEMNEDLIDSKKVTTYTITSVDLPEGLVLKYELNK